MNTRVKRVIPNNLPSRLANFVNREEEIQQAIKTLLEKRQVIVVLTGIGGIGKTSIALEIAYRLLALGEFKGGIVWIPSRNIQTNNDLETILSKVFDISIKEVVDYLKSNNCLLVIDGLNEIETAKKKDFERHLQTLSGYCTLLITSRYPPSLPQENSLKVSGLDEVAAIKLFKTLGEANRNAPSSINDQTITEIIQALEYHPLAISLAARLVSGNYLEAEKSISQAVDTLSNLGHEKESSALLHTLATLFQAVGNYSEATELYQRSLAIAKITNDSQGVSAALNNLAQIRMALGEYEASIQLYQQSLDIKKNLGDKYGIASTYNNLAQIYVARGDLDTAMQFYQHSLAIKEELGDRSGIATTLNNLAQIYVERGDLDTAMGQYQKSLAISEEVGDIQGKSAILNNMAQIYYERGDFDEALHLYEQALEIKQRLGDLQGKAVTLHQLGSLYAARKDFESAENFYNESLALTDQVGDVSNKATTLNNLGSIYLQLGDYEKALHYYKEALSIFRTIGLERQNNSIKNSIAVVSYELAKKFVDQDRWYDALSLLEESLSIYRENSDLSLRVDTIYEIARVHHLLGNLDKARTFYRDALRIYDHLDMKFGVAACRTGLGRLMIQMDFLDDAIHELESAKEIFSFLKEERRLSEVNEVLRIAKQVKERQSK